MEKDYSLSALARLQGQLNCLSEEYISSQTVTVGEKQLDLLEDKYKSLINRTIKQCEIPKEEPELTDFLEYVIENKSSRNTDVDRWISDALDDRLDFLREKYSDHPVIKRYEQKLEKAKEERRSKLEEEERESKKRRKKILLIIGGIILLFFIWTMLT